MKKEYQKPVLRIHKMRPMRMICQSDEQQRSNPRRHGGEFGYIPRIFSDDTQMA
jgi:hypothetical protein